MFICVVTFIIFSFIHLVTRYFISWFHSFAHLIYFSLIDLFGVPINNMLHVSCYWCATFYFTYLPSVSLHNSSHSCTPCIHFVSHLAILFITLYSTSCIHSALLFVIPFNYILRAFTWYFTPMLHFMTPLVMPIDIINIHVNEHVWILWKTALQYTLRFDFSFKCVSC